MSGCCGAKTIDATEYARALTTTPIASAWFCTRCRQITAVVTGKIEMVVVDITVGGDEKARTER